jgi:hypothetical protein
MRYFFGFLAAIGLIVIVFILILRGFSGNDSPQKQINLLDYTTSDTVMRLTVDGPVNADKLHQSYRITVGREEAAIEMMEGYDGKVVKSETLENTEEAYAHFLRSLQLMGYTKGNTDPNKADERGNCADGSRYVYEIISHNQHVQRFWSTSCGEGTFGGNPSQTRNLFARQIPDFTQFVKSFRAH